MPHLSLEVGVNVVQAGHVRGAVADHQLGQAALKVVDDGFRCFSRCDVTLKHSSNAPKTSVAESQNKPGKTKSLVLNSVRNLCMSNIQRRFACVCVSPSVSALCVSPPLGVNQSKGLPEKAVYK